ncbi:MAG: hypothetical protein IJQ82_06630 [Selenomonadaceae bacterium]|nr:hypothetical protein [Selenomonadaceae bacterium]
MAKKPEKKSETLSDYATDFEEWFSFDYSKLMPTDDAKPKQSDQPEKSVQVKKTVNQHAMRRVLSELALEKELPWHFEQGVSYHCISFGDVDVLTYFRVVVKQQRIRYALISTWCMASEDILEIRRWIEQGYIGRCDFYVGEIFKASYYKQYQELIALCKELGGRVAICRNHSKVMVLLGERFDCVVESSANVNTNPRIENCVITVDSELAHWYKNFYDGIKSFERNFDDVTPWQG